MQSLIQLAILGARLAGASEIIALDINEEKFALAKSLGATAVFNSGEAHTIEDIKQYTQGGVDYAFETAGVVPAMDVAYQITRRGGMTTTTGLPDPKHQFSFPQVTLAAEERTIKGSYVGSCVPDRDIRRLPVNELLTDTLPLEHINEGFDRLARGEAARLVVKMD